MLRHYTLSVPIKIPPAPASTDLVVQENGLARFFKSFFTKKPEPSWEFYTRTIEAEHEIRSGDDVRVGGVRVAVRERTFITGTHERPEGVMRLECHAYYIGSGISFDFDPERSLKCCKELEDAGFIRMGTHA